MPKKTTEQESRDERTPASEESLPSPARRGRAVNWTVNILFVLGVVLLFVAFYASTVIEGSARTRWTRIFAGAAAALFVGGLAVGWRELLAWLRTRATVEGLYRLVYIAAAWAIIGFAVYMGGRYHVRKDLTAERIFSLSDKSIEVVKDLQEPVEILSCIKKADGIDKADDLLSLYEALGGKLSVERLNPDKHYAKMVSMGLETKDNVVVVRRKGTTVKSGNAQTISLFELSEQKITSAILAVASKEKKKVYFLEGHNELSLDEAGATGITGLKRLLEDDQYAVAGLNLVTEKTVPADANAVVIARATMPIQDSEVEALRTYLNGGGGVLVLAANRLINKDAPDFAALLGDYGIAIEADLVADPGSPAIEGAPFWFGVTGKRLTKHPMTNAIARAGVFFDSETSSLRLRESQQPPQQPGMPPQPDDSAPTAIAKTTDLGYAQTEVPLHTSRTPADTPGPLTVAACAERPVGGDLESMMDPTAAKDAKKSKVAVFGDGFLACDADLFDDQNVQVQGGRLRTAGTYLVRDAIHWLTDSEDLISIPPKEDKDAPIQLERKQIAWNRFFVLLGPILPLALGLWVWYLRRG